jgi:hypothetical protein
MKDGTERHGNVKMTLDFDMTMVGDARMATSFGPRQEVVDRRSFSTTRPTRKL